MVSTTCGQSSSEPRLSSACLLKDFADFVGSVSTRCDLGYLARCSSDRMGARPRRKRSGRSGSRPDGSGALGSRSVGWSPSEPACSRKPRLLAFPGIRHLASFTSTDGDDEQLPQIDLAIGPQATLISRPVALEVGVALLAPATPRFS